MGELRKIKFSLKMTVYVLIYENFSCEGRKIRYRHSNYRKVLDKLSNKNIRVLSL